MTPSTATSHSSLFHAWGPTPTPDALAPFPPAPAAPAALPDFASTHHSPELRHGPADATMAPPANPARSVVTRTGRPSATATRAGTGWRHRRSAETTFLTSRGAPPPRAATPHSRPS